MSHSKTGFFFLNFIPSVSRHDFMWKTAEEFSRFLQWLCWILKITVQKENNTIIRRHVMNQVVFAVHFQIVQQILVGGVEKSSGHRFHRSLVAHCYP